MKLVTQTSVLSYHYGVKEALHITKESGFDGYDFHVGILVPETDRKEDEYYLEQAREIRAYADSIQFPCLQSHSISQSLREDNPDLLKACIATETISLKFAAILGAPISVVHPAFHLDAWENQKQFYSHLLPLAHEGNFKIATENMFVGGKTPEGVYQTFPGRCGTAEDFVRCVDAANDPHFTACMDIGHACMINCEGAPTIIRALGHDRLGTLHVHDNDCVHDNHIFPFMGDINWDEVCRALADVNYDGNFTYEADAGYRNLPAPLLHVGTEAIAKIGRYLIEQIESYKK